MKFRRNEEIKKASQRKLRIGKHLGRQGKLNETVE